MIKLFAFNDPIDMVITLYTVICEYYDSKDNCDYTVCCKWVPDTNDLSIIRLNETSILASIHIGHISRSRSHFEILLNTTVRQIPSWETDEITKLIDEYITV